MSPIILPVSGTGASLYNSPGAATPSRSRHAYSSFGISLDPIEAQSELRALVRRVQGSKRVVVICGAGVSTAANIPDFRSNSGIYSDSGAAQRSVLDGVCSPSPAKRARTGSRVKEPTVKDLFHVDALSSDRLRPAQNALLTDLYLKSTAARPTAFHRYLAQLEEEGRLLRCYTQNIDGLEGKAGLRAGIPEKEVRGRKRRRAKAEVEVEIGSVASSLGNRAIPDDDTPRPEASLDGGLIPHPQGRDSVDHDGGDLRTSADPLTPTKPRPAGFMPTPPSTHASSIASPLPCTPSPTAFALENPRPDLPRVVPLHGLLARLRCTLCPFTCSFSERMPMSSPGTDSDADADADADTSDLMQCPDCFNIAGIRTALAERQRQSGFLRPDIVLYGEDHRQGHLIGGMVEKDLKGLARAPNHGNGGAGGGEGERRGEKKEGKADLLIVAGTSLSIPGVKRMVKEFAKSIHGNGSSSTPITPSTSTRTGTGRTASTPSTPSKSRSTASTRSKAKAKGKVVFVNAEPPAKSSEWEGVFDYWVQGDVQAFVTEYLQRDVDDSSDGWLGMPTPPRTPKTPKTPRRRRTAPASTPAWEPRAREASAKKRIHISDSSTPVLPMSLPSINDGASTAYNDTCPTPRSDSSAFEMDVEVDDDSENQTPTRPRKITLQSRATVLAGEASRIGDADEAESPSGATARSASARKANRAEVLRAADDVFGANAEDPVSRSDRQKWQVERVLVGREESLTPLSDG